MARACFWLVLLALGWRGFAEDKKDEKKQEPPKLLLAVPFYLRAGALQTNKFRGSGLTNVTQFRLPTNSPVTAEIKEKLASKPPGNLDAAKFGDTELSVSFNVPSGFTTTNFQVVAVSTNGASEPFTLLVLSTNHLVFEKEPNNSFRKPQVLTSPCIVLGSIQDAHDVDVFEFNVNTVQSLTFEITAASRHSPLDSLLTLYDAKGHILKSNDDAKGTRDSRLEFTPKSAGKYLLGITDAHDHGSPLHTYVLEVR